MVHTTDVNYFLSKLNASTYCYHPMTNVLSANSHHKVKVVISKAYSKHLAVSNAHCTLNRQDSITASCLQMNGMLLNK